MREQFSSKGYYLYYPSEERLDAVSGKNIAQDGSMVVQVGMAGSVIPRKRHSSSRLAKASRRPSSISSLQ